MHIFNDDDAADPAPTIYLVDEDATALHDVGTALRAAGRRVASFARGDEFVSACPADPSGCLVLDAGVRLADGRWLDDALRQRGTVLPTIVISGEASVATAVAALQAGAVDFMEKPLDIARLLERSEIAFALDRARRRRDRRRRACEARLGRLTRREREVMEMVVAGKANKVVAIELGISPKTVETHRARLMAKLEVGSFADLVRLGWMAMHGELGIA